MSAKGRLEFSAKEIAGSFATGKGGVLSDGKEFSYREGTVFQ